MQEQLKVTPKFEVGDMVRWMGAPFFVEEVITCPAYRHQEQFFRYALAAKPGAAIQLEITEEHLEEVEPLIQALIKANLNERNESSNV